MSRGYKPSMIQDLLEPITHDKRPLALTTKTKTKDENTLTFVNIYNDVTPESQKNNL